MTLHNIATQLHSLSVGGYFNGERFTVSRLHDQLASWLRTGDKLVMEIALPDGRWLFSVTRFAPNPDGFDYYIPDTRDEENALKAWLLRH